MDKRITRSTAAEQGSGNAKATRSHKATSRKLDTTKEKDQGSGTSVKKGKGKQKAKDKEKEARTSGKQTQCRLKLKWHCSCSLPRDTQKGVFDVGGRR